MTNEARDCERAAELFAEWAVLFEHTGAPSFDAWIAERREHAPALRAHFERWRRVQPWVDKLAFDDRSSALAATDPTAVELSTGAVIAAIDEPRLDPERYEMLGEVGRGGMGIVFKAFDRHLERSVCIKVVRRQWLAGEGGDAALDERVLQRFVQEARSAARLAHPAIVPVHELGCDQRGRPYFTMDFVDGRDLGRILDEHIGGGGDGSLARLVGVLLRVSEALAFAHENGVLHRDVKPTNVMVGAFGQVYVMDWGLARTAQTRERELDTPQPASASGSSSLTREGHALGTVAYMAPEQARGELERIDARADVYSLGAVLYELLAGRRPYARESESLSASQLLARVRAGPPQALESCAPNAPTELVSICRKAMARERDERYPNARELASDLRAWLEGRVVAAHRTDRAERVLKWIRRNRSLSAALAALSVVAMVALGAIAWLGERSRRAREDVFRLTAQHELRELRRDGDELWPVHPRWIERYQDWLARAESLVAALPQHRETLRAIELRGHEIALEGWLARHPHDASVRALLQARASLGELEGELANDDERLAAARARVAELGASLKSLDRFEFDDARDHWWHDELVQLVSDLEAFADPERGCIAGVSAAFGTGVARRLALARELVALDQASTWPSVERDLAGEPRYAGLALPAQSGLVPLGRDPRSGLLEFAHLASGRVPVRDANGELALDDESCIVLVLIPAGVVELGAQRDAALPHYDASALDLEAPRQRVELDAFFLSKFEWTEAQWQHATGENPSYYSAGSPFVAAEHGARLPVENVSWNEVALQLDRAGLTLPTEAQWEYAARAGTSTIWHTGDDVASLLGYENIAGEEARAFFTRELAFESGFDDGFATPAPVGSLLPNAFGLHDVGGNLREWCRDKIGTYGSAVRRGDGDGERLDAFGRSYVMRGGSFYHRASTARSSARMYSLPTDRFVHLGCRPSRAIER